MKKPAINRVLQVCMVVDDLDAYVKHWNNDYGIGPWALFNFNESTLEQQRVEGADGKWGTRMALCNALNIQLELVQPLYGETTHMIFLREHGPGLHHLAIEPSGGFETWVENLKERSKDHFILGGNEKGSHGEREFEYVDLRDELGAILETYNDFNDFQPGPNPVAGTYPPSGAKEV